MHTSTRKQREVNCPMSTEIAHSIPAEPVVSSLSEPGIPYAMIQLKQDLNVLLLMTRKDLREYGEQGKFNQQQVAKLADCSRSTVKLAIKKGRLKKTKAGWITREQLVAWLEFDPIQEKIDKVVKLEKEIIRLTKEIELILTDRPV